MATKKAASKTSSAKKGGRRPTKKKTAAQGTAAKQGGNSTINLSEEIRHYLRNHPDAGPTSVVKALAKRGLEVSVALVSNVKATLKRKTQSTQTNATAPLDDVKQAGELMMQAVDLVLKAGAKEARQLVAVAEDMVKRVSDRRG